MKRTQQIDLEIIIVSYNGEFWLKKTLTTLYDYYIKKTKRNVLVTVVDNNSSDGSVKMLKDEFKWVNAMLMKDNFGFAIANNIALKKTKAKYAMLLNSDVELNEKSNFDILLNFLDKKPRIGMITPRVEFINGEIDPACHRGEPTPWASFTYFSKLEQLFPKSKLFGQYHQSYKDLKSIHTIDACTGAAMIVRRESLEKVGLLDERFFMYAEDLDWCKRYREAGYLVVYNPEVTIVHHKNKSGIKSTSQKIAKKTNKYFYDTMLQYYDKHYKDSYPSFIRTIIKYILVIKKGAL
ncbi:glycosyltransferase family 2 protein [Candidatus Woesebacteria bacterium]|nr:glycosyltransferase family 2 protein [Candidatus Woesebacteria bacterium]